MDTEPSAIVPVEPDGELTTQKQGLDIGKVERVMSREQERDLSFLYRVDQIKLFDEAGSKQFHGKAKPSDPISLQILFEIRDRYRQSVRDEQPKETLAYLKMMDDIAARAEGRRDKALERLFSWKKHAEDKGGLGEMTTAELERVASGK